MSRSFLGFSLMRVTGQSMSPTLNGGDYVLLRQYSTKRRPAPGDIAVYLDSSGSRYIKRVTAQDEDGRYRVSGDGALSAPSVDLGSIPETSFIARVVFAIRQKNRSS